MPSANHDRSATSATPLRRGWTTGACATAAAKAAAIGLLTGEFPDPVEIELPKGQRPAFALAHAEQTAGSAAVGIVKDAGDDPDVTHGATIVVTVARSDEDGVTFVAGEGVGTVTKAGLPIGVGEPAINPVPRQMIRDALEAASAPFEGPPGWTVTISVPGGEKIAEQTWNPRLGIVGGLSILGTTGIVNPFSCAAWIHSIHRGIDVARANGFQRVGAATGSTSERALLSLYPSLPLEALIDMGDFAGGMLKYLRRQPVPEVVIAGGFAKLTKLAQGSLDLHSARSQVSMDWLAARARELGSANVDAIAAANTAMEALALTDVADRLAATVASQAFATASSVLRGADVRLEIVVVDRKGAVLARAKQ